MATKVESADLILKLYDLRREKKMRKARNWIFGFSPTSAEEYWQTMMDPKVGPYLRMVVSYWDMAAAMVNHGAIDADLFNETAGEHLMIFAKLEPILGELRERFQNPKALANLEKVIKDRSDGMEQIRKMQEWFKTMLPEMAKAQAGNQDD